MYRTIRNKATTCRFGQ